MHIAETSGIREGGRHAIFTAARAPVAGSLFWCRDRKDTSFSQPLHFLVHGSRNPFIRCAQQLWLPPCTWIEGICKLLIDQCWLCQVLRSADLNMSLLLMTNPDFFGSLCSRALQDKLTPVTGLTFRPPSQKTIQDLRCPLLRKCRPLGRAFCVAPAHVLPDQNRRHEASFWA